jgi:hypothetical protein
VTLRLLERADYREGAGRSPIWRRMRFWSRRTARKSWPEFVASRQQSQRYHGFRAELDKSWRR